MLCYSIIMPKNIYFHWILRFFIIIYDIDITANLLYFILCEEVVLCQKNVTLIAYYFKVKFRHYEHKNKIEKKGKEQSLCLSRFIYDELSSNGLSKLFLGPSCVEEFYISSNWLFVSCSDNELVACEELYGTVIMKLFRSLPWLKWTFLIYQITPVAE